jgi:hypothetical protein
MTAFLPGAFLGAFLFVGLIAVLPWAIIAAVAALASDDLGTQGIIVAAGTALVSLVLAIMIAPVLENWLILFAVSLVPVVAMFAVFRWLKRLARRAYARSQRRGGEA